MSNKTPKNKTVLSISAKCSDLYSHTLYRSDGKIVNYAGYVPSFFPDSFSGNDYITLDIDPYTGQILNWKNWRPALTEKNILKELLASPELNMDDMNPVTAKIVRKAHKFLKGKK